MENNIVIASFSGCRSAVTVNRYQYDYGQKLHVLGIPGLPSVFEVHFASVPSSGEAKIWVGQDGVVDIPDEYLATGTPVYAWIFLHTGEADGETVYSIKIPVVRRPRPVSDEPTPQQQSEIDTAIAALNAGLESATESVSEAAASASASLESAEDAEAWALGTRGGEPVEPEDPQYENSAAYWADKAEQSAGQAGYMFFYIDDNGDLIYTHTTNVNVDFHLGDDGDLYVEAIS